MTFVHSLAARAAGGFLSVALVVVPACGGESTDGGPEDGGDGGTMAAGRGGQSNGGAAGRAGHSGVAGGAGGTEGGSSPAGRGGTADAGAGGAAGCTVGGITYAPGDSFPSSDGCNGCSCLPGGQVACTARACAGSGGGGSLTCDDVRAATDTELASIRSCERAEECGQVLEGTSCGCTRDLVARLDADATRFEELLSTTIDGEACNSLASTCDCPAADGFACVSGACTWNYVETSSCSAVPVGRLCILGEPIGSGDFLRAGDPLLVRVFPSGCHSSSCTEAVIAGCSLSEPSPREFVAEAEFCLKSNGDGACTADCGGGGDAHCTLESALTAGEHVLRFGEATFPFTVPGLSPGCIELGADG